MGVEEGPALIRFGAGGCDVSRWVRLTEETMATPTDQTTETPDSTPRAMAKADFETAQQRVFEETGIDPQSRFIDLTAPRVQIHVLELHGLDEEPPLLFLHGAGGFGAFFAPLMAYLDGTPMLAIDRPGGGLSDDFVYTTENHRRTAGDVIEGLLNELGIEQVDLVGSSTGGYWGIVFALTHPHRVRRLIPLGGVPTFPGTRPPFSLRLLTVPGLDRVFSRLQKPSEENVVKFMAMAGEGETVQQYPALIAAKVANDRIPRPASVGTSEFKSLLTIRGWRGATRLQEDELRTVRHSPLFIWGENDFLGTPNDVRKGIELIPDARLETFDAGHGPYLGYPEECARLIRKVRE